MVARNSFNGKFTTKIVLDHAFYVTITDAVFRSLKFLRTLLDKYLDRMLVKFEQNRMVRWCEIFKILSSLAKNG